MEDDERMIIYMCYNVNTLILVTSSYHTLDDDDINLYTKLGF